MVSRNKNASVPDDRNTFENPIGSVQSVYGTGGSVRHRGNFSQDNPWLDDMMNGANNQDIDAAYERAANWEADRWTVLEQRKYDEARLAEQREYDSPLQQIARERAAGINRDVAGGSGSVGSSGSSAQLQSLPMPQTQAQSKFSNAYDNANTVFNGINSFSSVLSSVTSFATGVVDITKTLQTLPAQIKLGNVQADILERSADSIVSKNNADATQAVLSTIDGSLDVVGRLGSLIPSDVKDEDIVSYLSDFGLSDSDVKKYSPAVQRYRNSPEQQNAYAERRKKQTELDAFNDNITPELLGESYRSAFDSQISSQRLLSARNALDQSIVDLLSVSNYSENMAEAAKLGSQAMSQEASTRLQKAIYDGRVFLKGVQQVNEEIQNLTNEIIAGDNTPIYRNSPEWNVRRKMILNRKTQLELLQANSIGEFTSIMSRYYSSEDLISKMFKSPGIVNLDFSSDDLPSWFLSSEVLFDNGYQNQYDYKALQDKFIRMLAQQVTMYGIDVNSSVSLENTDKLTQAMRYQANLQFISSFFM